MSDYPAGNYPPPQSELISGSLTRRADQRGGFSQARMRIGLNPLAEPREAGKLSEDPAESIDTGSEGMGDTHHV
jgi:hypothetical protein